MGLKKTTSSGWAKITRAANSLGSWFNHQISYNNRTSNALIVYPYGMHANAVPQKSMVLWFGVGGDDSNKAGFAFDHAVRPDLEECEVALYQPETNTIIKFVKDGSIEVNSDVKITATCPEIEANCENLLVNAATSVTLDTPDVTMTGNCQINGNLTVDAATTLSGTVTSNGKDISDTHTHIGSPTSPVGPVSPTGVPN